MALNTSGFTRTIALNIFNVLLQDRVYYWSSSQYVFTVRCLFLVSHFLVFEDYELSKSTSHLQSIEYVRILS